MNDLVKMTNNIQSCDKKDLPKQIMSVCRAITPQIYKNLSIEDMKAEKIGIELLMADIDGETAAEMCKRAVLNYPRIKSENPKTIFDINFIMQFYKQSFNFVHCEAINISRNAEKIWEKYDDTKKILYQKWKEPSGEIKIVGHIQEKRGEGIFTHQYSPKDFELMENNWEDVEI